MIVSLVAALDERGGIGVRNRLPWHLPDDLRRFKALTMGHHIIAGRKTYQSINRPLPGRTMIVVTRQADFRAEGCLICASLQQALHLARERQEEEVFVIGGGQIFTQALGQADRLYLTRVHVVTKADVFFPPFEPSEWVELESEEHPADEQHAYAFTFAVFHREKKRYARRSWSESFDDSLNHPLNTS